jgi:hypothetical protein
MHLVVDYGRALYVVGSSAELGAWNMENALRLTWTEVRVTRNLGQFLAWFLQNIGFFPMLVQIRSR